MGITVKPVFNRTNQKNKSGLYSIHIRLTIDKKTTYYNSDLPRIEKKYWSGKSNKWIKETHRLAFEFNDELIKKTAFIYESAYRLHKKESPSQCFLTIRKRLHLNNNTADFYKYFENKIPQIQLHKNTLKAYTSTLYLCEEYKKNLTFKELNKDFLIGLRNFAKNERKIADVTAKRYFSKLKIICDFAVEDGLLSPDLHPFNNWKGDFKLSKPKRVFLDAEEITALKELDLKDTDLSLKRDQFLVLAYTGQYYSDLKTSNWENIVSTEKGDFFIKDRIKGGFEYCIPLTEFPDGLMILKSYRIDGNLEFFPKYFSDQEFNRSLKILAKMANINKNITNKVGRHTFAQNRAEDGTPRAIVAKMLGHQKEETTQQYYDITINSIMSFYESR
jgi:integrase